MAYGKELDALIAPRNSASKIGDYRRCWALARRDFGAALVEWKNWESGSTGAI
jgi:hypothetical protein